MRENEESLVVKKQIYKWKTSVDITPLLYRASVVFLLEFQVKMFTVEAKVGRASLGFLFFFSTCGPDPL